MLIITSIGDEQMIHMTGLETSSEMWATLNPVHEQRGQQTITSTKHGFYSMRATENADILKHIIQMKHTHNKLHQMGCLIPESDEFQLILVTLLLESWDHFSASYCGTQSSAKSTGTCKVTTQELCNIIGDEWKKRKVDKVCNPCRICSKTNHITADCHFKGKPKCDNCGWFRHIAADC
ncbi:hypothetical protein PAXRUDRAFT_168366, partial [Paxillus rubicundulus Ve08.2h10]